MPDIPYLSAKASDRVVEQLIRVKVFHVVFTGGEPFLNKKVLFRVIEKLRVAGITVGINSNLVPLTLNDAKCLKKLGITSILTSLMGPTSKDHDEIAQFSGAFEKTVRGVHFLQEAEIPLMVNMVVSQKNKHLLKETASFVKSLGIKHFLSTRAGCPGNCSDFSEMSLNLQEFRNYLADLYKIGQEQQITVGVLESYPLCAIKEIKRYRAFTGRYCLAGVTTLTIATDGNIRPCSHLDVSYGNIFNEELIDAWGRMQEWRDGSLLPPVCHHCKILARCGGGCRMEAKMRNGSFVTPDPYVMPQDVDYVVQQLAMIERQKGLPLPPVFKLNPKIRWRNENFGSVIFLGPSIACYLNSAATELLQELSSSRVYSTSDFIGRFEGDVQKFLAGLYSRRILLPA